MRTGRVGRVPVSKAISLAFCHDEVCHQFIWSWRGFGSPGFRFGLIFPCYEEWFFGGRKKPKCIPSHHVVNCLTYRNNTRLNLLRKKKNHFLIKTTSYVLCWFIGYSREFSFNEILTLTGKMLTCWKYEVLSPGHF